MSDAEFTDLNHLLTILYQQQSPQMSNCASQGGGASGCSSLTQSDVVYIVAAAAFCVLVLSVIAAVLIIRKVRQRRRRGALNDTTPMTSPLLPVGYQPTFMQLRHDHEQVTTAGGRRSRPLPSPLSSSESFHFPVLSADGHLLPPPSPSAQSVRRLSRDFSDARPLPEAPALCKMGAPGSHIPPVRGVRAGPTVVGLYPSDAVLPSPVLDARRSRGYDLLPMSVAASTPKVEQTWGLYQPQSATYHRSFSAEGEALTFGDP